MSSLTHRRRRIALVAALSSAFVVVPACAPAEDRGSSVLADRLRACGLVSAGDLGPSTLSQIYAPDACYARCLAEASCERLEAGLCRSMLDLLVACDERCAFRCEDGGLIGVERVCDGASQCMGGEDEVGCHFDLVCANGARVPGARCDGAWNCPDGSDETGCPSQPSQCADGSGYLYPWQYCDGVASCRDGSDEAGCPSFPCADGRTITYRDQQGTPRCNGYVQCADGSDELGCARLTLTCGG